MQTRAFSQSPKFIAYTLLEQRIALFIEGKSPESFESLLLEAHTFQATYNPVVASKIRPKSWQAIPAIPLEAFKEFRVTPFSKDEIVRVFHTSGTTGTGAGKHEFHSLNLYQKAACEGWRLAGLAHHSMLAFLSHPHTTPHSSLAQMAAWLTPEKNFILDQIDCLSELVREAPVVLFGTALAFLDYFKKFPPLSLPDGSLVVQTGGYKGKQHAISKIELYQLFEEHFGLSSQNIINEYGMTELSSQFYARGLESAHQAPPWARAIVIDPETNEECCIGDTGVLRLFDLANLGSACILQTRDLAIRREDGFELLGRDPSALPRGCSRLEMSFNP